MKTFCFAVCAVFLFASPAASQTDQSQPKGKDAVPLYQSAFLEKMTASVRAETNDVRHTTMVDSFLISERVLTYKFVIRPVGKGVEYVTLYTPKEQRGSFPDAWWKGHTLVGIRFGKHKLYLKLPQDGEINTRIVGEAAVAK